MKDMVADFGEPCEKCIHASECKFNWFSILYPLRKHSKVKISMVVQEQNQPPDSIPYEIEKGRDIHCHTDKKN